MIPLLGICIPTYNREKQLVENISNLIEKVGNYNIPIYISDNASTDDTEKAVLSLMERYPPIRYSKNFSNVGAEKNFEIVLNKGKEKYLWLLGDDDTIRGDIEPILRILISREYDALIIGSANKSGGLQDFIYNDLEKALVDLAGPSTWISSLILSNNLIKKMDFLRYEGSKFAHTAALFDALSQKQDILLYSYHFSHTDRIVDTMRKYFSDFSENAFEIFTDNWMTTICSLPMKFSYNAKLEAIKNLPTAPFRDITLIMYRSWGTFNRKMLIKRRKEIISIGAHLYWKMYLIALMPVCLAKVIVLVGKKYRKYRYKY